MQETGVVHVVDTCNYIFEQFTHFWNLSSTNIWQNILEQVKFFFGGGTLQEILYSKQTLLLKDFSLFKIIKI